MAQTTVNERLKILIDSLGLSVRGFSELIGDLNSNTNNYIGDRQSMPPVSFLEKVVNHIENINPKWLITGSGEPFLPGTTPPTIINQRQKKNKGPVVGAIHGSVTTNNYTLSDCEKERDTCKSQLDKALGEIVLLREQLERADALVAAKEEMLTLLRSQFNRPN